MEKSQKIISFLLSLGLIISFIVIYYLAQGYRLDFDNQQIEGTGILTINSQPNGALIILDGEKKTSTNNSIGSLKPGKYQIELRKEGYHSWTKEVEIEKELVTEIDARLAPLFPSLNPLTFTNAENPILSPDGQKIVYTADYEEEKTLWLLEITERPFNLSPRARQLIDSQNSEFALNKISWSPDSQKILIEETKNYLLDITNKEITEIEDLDQIQESWQTERLSEDQEMKQNLPPELENKIDYLNHVSWSPDRTSLLHTISENDQTLYKVIVFKKRIREDPTITGYDQETPYLEYTAFTADSRKFSKSVWFPDSKHLIILEKETEDSLTGNIYLCELDGENCNKIFNGIIQNGQVFPFISGAQIAILTTLNSESGIFNLYSLSLE